MRPGLLLLAALLSACSPRSIESYQTAENDEELVRLLNERSYGKAIWLVESRHGKTPQRKNTAFLLAQAYLGQAGFEPLGIAARVSGSQSFATPDARELLPSCPATAIHGRADTEPLCLLKRLFLHVPDPDLYEMTRARELLRFAHPAGPGSPAWVNVLIGAVESACVIRRAGAVFLFARRAAAGGRPEDAELAWLVRQAKLMLEEAGQALRRAEHSGKRISQLLTGSTDTVWFEQARNGVAWSERIGLLNLFDLLRAELLEKEEERHGAILDRIRALLEEQERRLAR